MTHNTRFHSKWNDSENVCQKRRTEAKNPNIQKKKAFFDYGIWKCADDVLIKEKIFSKVFFLPMTSVSIVSVVAIGEQFVKWRRRVLGDKQHRLLASCTFQQSTAKIANAHQHDEAVLKPLNISVDKKTQEKGKDIRLDWYFAMAQMFAIGSWQAWLAVRPHVW